MLILNDLTQVELLKAARLIIVADRLRWDLTRYGWMDRNTVNGSIYVWIEDYLYSLYINLNGDLYALYENDEGEHVKELYEDNLPTSNEMDAWVKECDNSITEEME